MILGVLRRQQSNTGTEHSRKKLYMERHQKAEKKRLVVFRGRCYSTGRIAPSSRSHHLSHKSNMKAIQCGLVVGPFISAMLVSELIPKAQAMKPLMRWNGNTKSITMQRALNRYWIYTPKHAWLRREQ